LTELLTTRKRVKNFNIAVREWDDRIIFLRKLVPGGTSRSYGIQVARIAGIPMEIIKRAKEILENLEGEDTDEAGRPKLAMSGLSSKNDANTQLNLFAGYESKVIKWIRELNVNRMTPLEALVELEKIQKYVTRKDNETKVF
jgi:DNA mismatch repair protein MutS